MVRSALVNVNESAVGRVDALPCDCSTLCVVVWLSGVMGS